MPVLLVNEELSGPIMLMEVGRLESRLFNESMSLCFLSSEISRKVLSIG